VLQTFKHPENVNAKLRQSKTCSCWCSHNILELAVWPVSSSPSLPAVMERDS